MKNRIILIVLITLIYSICLGQITPNAIINFKDNTDSTYVLVQLENPNYPVMTPLEDRWLVMAYLSKDNKINPLSKKGLPTKDDIINPYNTKLPGTIIGQVTYGLRFGPTEVGIPLSFGGSVITPEHFGKYIYIRIFNAHKLEDATKYMVLSKPFKITQSGPQDITIIPEYGWDLNPVWKSFRKNKSNIK